MKAEHLKEGNNPGTYPRIISCMQMLGARIVSFIHAEQFSKTPNTMRQAEHLNEENNPGTLPRIVSSIQMLGARIFSFKNAEQFNKIPNNPFLYSNARLVSFINAEQYNKTANFSERKAHLNITKNTWCVLLQGGTVARGGGCKGARLQWCVLARVRFLFVEGLVGGMAHKGAARVHLMLSPVVCGARKEKNPSLI
jgi:hypothetical protein